MTETIAQTAFRSTGEDADRVLDCWAASLRDGFTSHCAIRLGRFDRLTHRRSESHECARGGAG